MKYLKKFNESIDSDKLYWNISYNDEGYSDSPTVDFNINYFNIIKRRLSDDWIANIQMHSGKWLDIQTIDQEKCVTVFQSEDDYFYCDVTGDEDIDVIKCDTFEGLINFLEEMNIII